jgi:hypothetical protein
MALSGADVVQVFRYCLDAGQNEVESFSSTQRVFRGVPLTGRSEATGLRGAMSKRAIAPSFSPQ